MLKTSIGEWAAKEPTWQMHMTAKIINDPFDLLEFVNGLRQHQLRTSKGGDNPGRKDAHGNTIYRCNVHGQYRLHFTRDGAERVTFLSVNTHDDLLL